MKKRHVLSVGAGIASAVLLLSGCSGTSSPGTTGGASAGTSAISLAGVYENTGDPFWASVVCGATAEAKKQGVKFTVSSIPTQDESKLSTTLDTALLSKPTGLVFNPIDASSWSAKVSTVMKTGVPVVTSTSELASSQYGYVQASQDGSQFAPQVTKVLGGETGKAVTLLGLAKAPWQTQRLGGITTSIKKNVPGLTFLPDQIDGFDINKGTQLLTSVITANPDLKLILAVAGPEGQAAAAAVKQTNNVGKIHVISFDAVPAEQDAVRSGAIDLLLAQPAGLIGSGQVKLAIDYLKSSDYKAGSAVPVANKSNIPALGVITKDNIDDPSMSGYLYKTTCS